jgi:serine/threonine protein kinase
LAALEEIPVGTTIGSYRISAPLDVQSGFHKAYLAEHRLFARKVIVSQMYWGRQTHERFARWLGIMERLQHPRILGLLDCGEYGGVPFAIMPYLEGRTFDRVVAAGRHIDIVTAVRLFYSLADALAHCHRQQIAHRALKLNHVLLCVEGTPYLKGFEVASGMHGDPVDGMGVAQSPDIYAPELWQYHERYLRSPEGHARGDTRWQPAAEDLAKADVWAFGLIMYAALTGSMPVGFEPTKEFICSPDPLNIAPLNDVAPSFVSRVIGRCLHKDPLQRCKDGESLERALGVLLTQLEGSLSPAIIVPPEVRRGLLVYVEPFDAASRGRYVELQVTNRIGGGAFSDVYRVERAELAAGDESPLALKVLKREFAEDPVWVERFRREAAYLLRVKHPNVVRVHGFGALGATFFILTEMLDGVTLHTWMRENSACSVGQASRIVRQVAAGLSAMHEAALVHRDLKPANIMLMGEGVRVVITDFGIAHGDNAANFTQIGEFLGTPAYAAPEQLLGRHPNAQTDLYALGVIFYELITGQRPRQGTSIPDMLSWAKSQEPPDLRHLMRSVPQLVRITIAQLLARDPKARPNSAAELLQILQAPDFDSDGPLDTPSVVPQFAKGT